MIWVKACSGKIFGKTPISKIPKTKQSSWSGSDGMDLVSKDDALSSNPSITRKKRKNDMSFNILCNIV
jgi:hypothetical protein